jgi:hypothetical protein
MEKNNIYISTTPGRVMGEISAAGVVSRFVYLVTNES